MPRRFFCPEPIFLSHLLMPLYAQELASCIKLLDEWEVDVNKLTEGKLRYQQRQEALETLQSEQVELENQINVSRQNLPGRSPPAMSLSDYY